MKLILKRIAALLLSNLILAGSVPVNGNTALSGVSPEAAAAYVDVLIGQQSEYGVYWGCSENCPENMHDRGVGVAYAKLADFTGDGRDELFLMCISDYSSVSRQLWTWNGSEAVRMDAAEEMFGNSLAIFENRTVCVEDHYEQSGGGWRKKSVILAADGNSLSELASIEENCFSSGDQKTYTCLINGEEVCRKTVRDEKETCREAQDFHSKYYLSRQEQITFGDSFQELPGWAHNDVAGLLGQLALRACRGNASAAALTGAGYIGDPAQCRMSADMADAYASLLRTTDAAVVRAALFDGGNGLPLLWIAWGDGVEEHGGLTGHYNDRIYQYSNGTPVGCQWMTTLLRAGEDGVMAQSSITRYSDFADDFKLYRLNGGSIAQTPFSSGIFDPLNGSMIDGRQLQTYDKLDVYRLAEPDAEILLNAESGLADILLLTGNWTDGAAMEKALCSYAETANGYDYPRPNEQEDSYVEDVAACVAEEFGGEIDAIYQLSDGVYYVVLTIDGTQGALVRGSRKDGEIQWDIERHDETLPDEEELDRIANEAASKRNVPLDFGTISGFGNVGEIRGYLKHQLDNMDGIAPNDRSKAELTAYISDALTSLGTAQVHGLGNLLRVDPDEVGDIGVTTQVSLAQLQSLLEEEGVDLNKEIRIILRMVWGDADWTQPCEVRLDSGLISALNGNDLCLLVGDEQHFIRITADALQELVGRYGELSILLARMSENIYRVDFRSGDDELIDRLDPGVTLGLPAKNMTSTVMVTYGDHCDNWGGQYDPEAGTLAFEAHYSGQYEIVDNNVEITDIGGLDADTQAAIRFLVSKGYMSAQDGEFHPEECLTRYAFTQAVTGMFFALDHELRTTFQDVPENSPYYPYVASAEADRIINGFSDGSFSGEHEMTVEQMLSIAARTLIERKGYVEPEDAEPYLRAFEDGGTVSEWAQAQVAMAVRDGLQDRGGMLEPQADVTRAQAAVILYRLFPMLYEVQILPMELPEAEPVSDTGRENAHTDDAALPEDGVDGAEQGLGAGASLAIAGAVCVGGAMWFYLRKRRKKRER